MGEKAGHFDAVVGFEALRSRMEDFAGLLFAALSFARVLECFEDFKRYCLSGPG